MDIENKTVRGTIDSKEAVKQSVYRILNTERYKYIIYPWWYGMETQDLYGKPVTYVCPELERRIKEALAVDSRILSVSDFTFDTAIKGVVGISFVVRTVYGEIKAGKEVKV
nr:MAG TPA: Protein of unknown function (DUF2634) [Caudoviricetes sp.]